MPMIYMNPLAAGITPGDLGQIGYEFSAASTLPDEIGARWQSQFGRYREPGTADRGRVRPAGLARTISTLARICWEIYIHARVGSVLEGVSGGTRRTAGPNE